MSLVPYDDRDGFIWMDGIMSPWRDVKVHVLTHGLHYGRAGEVQRRTTGAAGHLEDVMAGRDVEPGDEAVVLGHRHPAVLPDVHAVRGRKCQRWYCRAV
jgi:hypothetical protein